MKTRAALESLNELNIHNTKKNSELERILKEKDELILSLQKARDEDKKDHLKALEQRDKADLLLKGDIELMKYKLESKDRETITLLQNIEETQHNFKEQEAKNKTEFEKLTENFEIQKLELLKRYEFKEAELTRVKADLQKIKSKWMSSLTYQKMNNKSSDKQPPDSASSRNTRRSQSQRRSLSRVNSVKSERENRSIYSNSLRGRQRDKITDRLKAKSRNRF